MNRLILINGAPASGKSTLAQSFVSERALALALDVDAVRGMLGQWLEHPVDAGVAARKLALAMARAHLQSGHDVVVAQFLGRLEFVEQLDALAAEVGVPFVEIALVSDATEAAARFARRAQAPETQEHHDAAALQERSGGPAELARMYQRLLAVIEARPGTRTVVTMDGEVEETYNRLLAAIEGLPGADGKRGR